MASSGNQRDKRREGAGQEAPTEQQNRRRYWIVSSLTAALLGVAGITIVVLAFMVSVITATEQTQQGMIFIGISFALLIFFFLNYICNRIIYVFFLRFAPLPKSYRMISCLLGWGSMLFIYIIMCLFRG